MKLLLLVLLLLSPPLLAQESGDYEKFFAAGMQKYAEGQHNEALGYLYRAYAYKPSSTVLALIIRTHDFMGHCSAADRQTTLFESLYPEKKKPNAQMCATRGTIAVSCDTPGFVFIDDGIEVRCGQSVDVPVGRHEIFSREGRTIDVAVKQNRQTKIEIVEPIAKLPLDYEMRLKPVKQRADEKHEATPRFRVWVRTNLRDDPDLNTRSELPGFEIYQDADGLFHVFSDALKPVQSKDSSTTTP